MSSAPRMAQSVRREQAKKSGRVGASKQIYGHLAVVKLVQIAGYDFTLGSAAKRMLTLVTGYSNMDGHCWPSVSQIADDLGLSRAAVAKQLAILEEHEYLQRTESYGENGRRTTNIISLNLTMAKEFSEAPNIFDSKNTVMLIAVYATLLGCRGMQLQEIAGDATSDGCINTVFLKENLEENGKKSLSSELKKSRVGKAAWEGAKKRQEQRGISRKQERELEVLADELREFKNANQMTTFDLGLKKAAVGLSAKDAMAFLVEGYSEELSTCRRKIDAHTGQD